MITPIDKDHADLAEIGGCITYVRGLTPEEVAIRLGGRLEDFKPATFHQLFGSSSSGALVGITAVGDWVMIVEMGTTLGITTDIVTRLSAGTRLVSHYCLEIKGLDYFYWLEDGRLRFCFIAQDGYMDPVPDELVETMHDIYARYQPLVDVRMGPIFLLAEHLTGIKLTPELLEEATYLCGIVPEPEWDIMSW
ncbi:DUF6461 domain-containing protein [Nonomuraea gerenzanensis]|uniref:Uncharacterized protein n=1 Tax=Nonomuraea gerenzanensis TaxID=93944 RepID=A0A1M4EQX6_9ACTN|nr:DUF6461 domain-containing protein [Nonomuraea gerenzanensis]UBU12699.1 DUF6461 domain-containing protein [Nonomuraea gerenzanensis]SBP01252.1 FIG01137708: hypothetical protein [Nonomuraea gerenzanensis]